MSVELNINAKKIRDQFSSLKSPQDLAQLLDIKYSQLTYHLYVLKPERSYLTFSIPKRAGGVREISCPSTALKIIQRKLNQVLKCVYEPKPSVFGFVPHHNIKDNALKHIEKQYVLNIDLKNFFPSINFGRVRGMFMGIPYHLPADVATVLAKICCYENCLPQGAPTSPIISNMICAQLDSQLARLSDKYNCIYTRYADDITFSTRSLRFPSELANVFTNQMGKQVELGEELTSIIEENGFEINFKKVRLQKSDQRQEVTGITVNERPNVNRNYIRQVRAMLHAWKKHGLEEAAEEFHNFYDKKHRHPSDIIPSFKHVVRGKIEFIGMIRGKNDKIYLECIKQYQELLNMLKPPIEIQNSLNRFRVDYPNTSKTAFIMMRFSSSTTHNHITTTIKTLLENHGLKGVRADDKQYHPDLYSNILTYLYGCGFGIVVFERIKDENFNPNVSLELGYMLALQKPICLLKDDSLQTLHSDLVGKLYRVFDTHNIDVTISNELLKWLKDNGIT